MVDEPRELGSGRYEVRERLGSGGMATVYLGTDGVLGRAVAIKVLLPRYASDPGFVERFRREAQSAARLNHPGVVSVYDTGSDGDTHWIVMEHVAGRTVADIVAQEGRLMPERAAEIAEQVAAALSFAHAEGIVHRDIKSANVMIAPPGEVKVMDFGIARADTDDTLTKTAFVMGTANYLSPEQAEGARADARSDIYSLGVVLFEMLTGAPPFTGESAVAVAAKHIREDPPLPSELNAEIPPPLESIVLKALAKNPDNRYQSADEMRADLERWRTGLPLARTTEPIGRGGTAVLPAAAPPSRRRSVPLVIAALVAAAVLGAILAAALTGNDGKPLGAPRPDRTTPSPVETTTPPPAEPGVEQAAAILSAILTQGLASGRIDDKASGDLQHKLEEVLKEFSDGDPEKALEKVVEMQDKVTEYQDKGQISNPGLANHLGRALDQLAAALQNAGGVEGD